VYVVHVSDPKDLDRVCIFLRSVQLSVDPNDDGTVTVTAPGARTAVHEQREIGGYVTTWNALNPASPITMVQGR
jgi:hypothetical protein